MFKPRPMPPNQNGPLAYLPPEVWLNILTMLASMDLPHLWVAAKVCSAWRHLAFDNSLWKQLYFKFWKVREDADAILAAKVAAADGEMHTGFKYFLRNATNLPTPATSKDSSFLAKVDWYRMYGARFALEHRWHATDKLPSQYDGKPSFFSRLEQGPRSELTLPSHFQPPETFCVENAPVDDVKRTIYTVEIDDGADSEGRTWCWLNDEDSMSLPILSSQLSSTSASTSPCRRIRATPDCPLIISGSRDCSIRIWDSHTQNRIFEGKGHIGSVLRVRLDGHRGRLYSSGSDGRVIVWDYICMMSFDCRESSVNEAILHVLEHPAKVLDIVVGEECIVTCCMDGLARVYSKEDYRLLMVHSHGKAINGACIPARTPDEVVTISSDNVVSRWQLKSGNTVLSESKGAEVPTCVSFIDHHRILGSAQGEIFVQNDSDEIIWSGHAGIIRALAVNQDRRVVVSAGHDGRTHLWRIGEHTPVFTLRRSPYGLLCVATSMSKIATGGKNGAICIRDFGDGLDTSIFA